MSDIRIYLPEGSPAPPRPIVPVVDYFMSNMIMVDAAEVSFQTKPVAKLMAAEYDRAVEACLMAIVTARDEDDRPLWSRAVTAQQIADEVFRMLGRLTGTTVVAIGELASSPSRDLAEVTGLAGAQYRRVEETTQ